MSAVVLTTHRIAEAKSAVTRIDLCAPDTDRTASVFARSERHNDPDPNEPYWWCSWSHRFEGRDYTGLVISDADMTRAQAIALAERHVIGIPAQLPMRLDDAA